MKLRNAVVASVLLAASTFALHAQNIYVRPEDPA